MSDSENLCEKCVALCCRYFALQVDTPEDARQYDDIRWYLAHENVVVFIESKKWYVGILNKCKHLAADNRCGIYETRPRICRGYVTDNCDYHGGDYGYEQLFTSSEQLREYYEKKFKRPLVVRPARPPRLKVKRGRTGRKEVSLPLLST